MVADEALVNAIKKKLISGYPQGELRNDLLEKGHTVEEIERLFFVASGHLDKPTEAKAQQNSGAAMFKLIGVALLITGITIMGTGLWLKDYSIYLLIAGGLCLAIGFINVASNKPEQNR